MNGEKPGKIRNRVLTLASWLPSARTVKREEARLSTEVRAETLRPEKVPYKSKNREKDEKNDD